MRWIIQFLLKLRYRIRYEGVTDRPHAQAVIVVDARSRLDPLFVALGWRQPLISLLPKRFSNTPFLKFFQLPDFDRRVAPFSNRRLLKRVETFSSQKDLLVVEQQKQSELLPTLLKHGVHTVYLVTVHGMKGSHFSFAPSKQGRQLKPSWGSYLMLLLKNGLFFMPKRHVVVTFSAVKDALPQETTALNALINHWFIAHSQESEQLVPYLFWKKIDESPERVIGVVMQELRRLSGKEEISETMELYADLGLDSLDVTEIVVFIEKTFQEQARFDGLRCVKDVIQYALGYHPAPPKQDEIQLRRREGWIKERPPIEFTEGETIPELFFRSCDRMGTAAAAVDPQGVVSYLRMKTNVVGLIELLERLPGQNVGLMLPSSTETISIVVALMVAKKVPTMLNWSLGNRHLEEVALQANLRVIITVAPLLASLSYDLSDALVSKIVLVDEIKDEITTEQRERGVRRARLPTDQLLKEVGTVDPDQVAVLLFTSGTEKAPKGVPLTHRNLLLNQKGGVDQIDFRSTDVLLGILPPFHIFGFSLTHLLPILIGCRVVLNPTLLDVSIVGSLIEQTDVTLLCTAPTFLKAILTVTDEKKLASLRYCIVGAEKMAPTIRKQIPTHCRLIEGYGLTECSPLVTLNTTGDPSHGVGYPIEGVKIRLLDPVTHRPTEAKIGLIALRGPSIFRGYWNGDRPFVHLDGQEWFLTGDLGSVEEGALHLVGRLSRTLKMGGELISFPALEEALQKAFPTHLLAIVAPDDQLTLCTSQPLTLDDVNHALTEAGWSNIVRIKAVRHVDPFPLTPTGKIDFRRLQMGN